MTTNDFGASYNDFKAQERTEKDDSFCNDFVRAGIGLLDVTFESDLFEFSVTESAADDEKPTNESRSTWFSDFTSHNQNDQAPPTVHVAIHEQLSAVYDDFSQEGSISVTGSVHVTSSSSTPMNLKLYDELLAVQRVEPLAQVCKTVKHMSNNREFLIEVNALNSKEGVLIANYCCDPKVKPVPLVRNYFNRIEHFVLDSCLLISFPFLFLFYSI